MEQPLISVVVPTRNRVGLLKRAVESIVKQSYANLEVIVVDDASEDGTRSEVLVWRRNDERIRYIRNPKRVGAAVGRNRAAEAASGRYICFLDDDDIWEARKLELQARWIDQWSALGSRISADSALPRSKRSAKVMPIRCVGIGLHDIWLRNGGISPSSFMCTMDLFRSVGGFDAALKANQGKDLFLRIYRAVGKLGRVEDVLVYHDQAHGAPRISDNWHNRIEATRELQRKHSDLLDWQTRNLLRVRELRNMKAASGKLSMFEVGEAIGRTLLTPTAYGVRFCLDAVRGREERS